MSKVIVCTCDNTYKSYESYWNSVDFEFEFLSDRYPTGIEYDEQK